MLEILQAKPMGRVLKYDPKTKKTEELLKDLYFPNGILLSPDESYLLVAELTKVFFFVVTSSKKLSRCS
jgi:sugar lactone lactonase YvrE